MSWKQKNVDSAKENDDSVTALVVVVVVLQVSAW